MGIIFSDIMEVLAVRAFAREKKIYCGDKLVAASIFVQTEGRDQAGWGRRAGKQKESSPKQRDLNDKAARRYYVALANGNFGAGDMVVHATYAPEHLPATEEEAKRQAANYIARLERRHKKEGHGEFKHLLVTQIGEQGRIHHHILISGGLSRDTVEELWRPRRKKGQPPELLGWVNADRLRPNDKGIAQMAGYMARESAGKRRWSGSHNLDKPWSRKNDSRYSIRQLQKIAALPADSEAFIQFWQKKYPGCNVNDIEPVYSEISGWSFYIQLYPMSPAAEGRHARGKVD